ncbi:MAG: sulfatase-like hydrolase/transferase [Alloalcanivorax sp.]
MKKSLHKNFFIALLFVFIPNAVFLVLAWWLDVNRPTINFDYAMLALIVAVCPRWLALPIFVTFLFFDVLGVVRQVIPIVNVMDSFYLLSFIGVAPFFYQLAFLFSMLMFFILAGLLWRFYRSSSKEALVIVVNVLLGFYALKIFLLGASGDTYIKTNDAFIESQIVSAYEASSGSFVDGFSIDSGDVIERGLVPSATESWFDDPQSVGDKVLLVVSESWGVTDERVQNAVLSPLLNSSVVSDLSLEELNVSGVTVQGEVRELCRLRARHFNLKDVTDEFNGCLPAMYERLGYHTMAIHGAAGAMYGRRKWYPKLGFDKTVFFESKQWKKRCYSFPGVCDEELMKEVGAFFQGESPAFVYWLTLNSHIPYDRRDLSVDLLDCGSVGVLPSSKACSNLKLHYQFFYYLEKLLHERHMSGLRVIVVGDHDPPMLSDKDRKYFKKFRVPWIEFSRRGSGD